MFLNVWLSVEFLLWWYKSNQERKQVVSQLPFARTLLACLSLVVFLVLWVALVTCLVVRLGSVRKLCYK